MRSRAGLWAERSIPANATENLAQRWKVKEDVTEGYFKLNFESSAIAQRMSGNIGVRLLDVKTTSEAISRPPARARWQPVTVDHDYSEVLPSANVNFNLTETTLLRFGVSRSSRVRRSMSCGPVAR